MAGNEILTMFVGNVTADPELRHTPQKVAVLNMRIASTPRVFDRDAEEHKDGKTTFIDLTLWRNHAENAAASLSKGSNVMGWGFLRQDDWEDDDGNKRTKHFIEVTEIGPSLQWATAEVTKAGVGKKATNSGGKPAAKAKPAPQAAVASNKDDEF